MAAGIARAVVHGHDQLIKSLWSLYIVHTRTHRDVYERPTYFLRRKDESKFRPRTANNNGEIKNIRDIELNEWIGSNEVGLYAFVHVVVVVGPGMKYLRVCGNKSSQSAGLSDAQCNKTLPAFIPVHNKSSRLRCIHEKKEHMWKASIEICNIVLSICSFFFSIIVLFLSVPLANRKDIVCVRVCLQINAIREWTIKGKIITSHVLS